MNVKEASHPFNKSAADTILRSSDLVDFRVRRSILAEASPIFQDLFRLPQIRTVDSDDEPDDADWKDGVPVIAVTEDSKTLDRLLRLCYPIADPVFQTLDEEQPVLEAALKYMMEEVVPIMRKHLSADRHAGHALRVFAIACRHNFELEARIAARRMLFGIEPLSGQFVSELEEIPAGTYFRLLQYHRNGGATQGLPPNFCDPPKPRPRMGDERNDLQADALRRVLVASYPYLLASPDVTLRSSDDTEFRVHSLILGTVSPIFRRMFVDLEQHGRGEDEDDTGCPDVPRVFQVSEDGQTLARLLQYCYPVDYPVLETLSAVRSLLLAARKYEIATAIDVLRKRLMKLAELSPLRVFAISCAHRWVSEAREAARLTLHISIEGQYVDELEDVSAGSYFRLLQYREECGRVASQCVLNSPMDGCLSVDYEWTSYSCNQPNCRIDGPFSFASTISDPWPRYRPREWLGNYVRSSALAVSSTPWGAVVTDDELLGRTLAEATACGSCRPRAYAHLRRISTIISAEVECAISGVAINLP